MCLKCTLSFINETYPWECIKMLGSSFKHQGTWGLSWFPVTILLSSSFSLWKKRDPLHSSQHIVSWQGVYFVAINARTWIFYKPGQEHCIESELRNQLHDIITSNPFANWHNFPTTRKKIWKKLRKHKGLQSLNSDCESKGCVLFLSLGWFSQSCLVHFFSPLNTWLSSLLRISMKKFLAQHLCHKKITHSYNTRAVRFSVYTFARYLNK